MEEKQSKSQKKRVSAQRELVAKMDWHLCCPPHVDRVICKGDDVSDLDEKFLKTLQAEGVIDGGNE